MWTVEQRRAHARVGPRYPSDPAGGERALVEPFIPPGRRGGRRRTVDVREVLNGIFYVLATGCQGRALPKDPPPKSTVHGYPALWARDGTRRRHAPLVQAGPGARAGGQRGQPHRGDQRQPEREGCGKRGPRVDPSGRDAGKRVKGKKRHILVDTLGLLLSAGVHPASIPDRDGAMPLLRAARRLFPFAGVISADGAYRGEATAGVVAGRPAAGGWRSSAAATARASCRLPLPKRWLVERTSAWLGRCRRLAKGIGDLAVNALAFLRLGTIRLMLRRRATASDRS
jgi:transposase